MHLPNFYSDEDWNELSDEERERSQALFTRMEYLDTDELNDRITAIYEEADEIEANIEGTSDIWHANALRREAEDLIEMQRRNRENDDAN